MWRGFLAVVLLGLSWSTSAQAQFWGYPSYDRGYERGRPYWDRGDPYARPYPRPQRRFDWYSDEEEDEERPPRREREDGEVRDGGERPTIAPIAPQRISFPSQFPVGSIVIDTKGRQLFLIESPETALHYPISVGRDGFSWTGIEKISRKAQWPDWHPPEEMRERDPNLPVRMTGGLRNPLGAMALYLGNTLYRIHGTNDPNSIGRASSSGCFRMLNGQVIDLASRVDVGTPVQVVSRLPANLERLVLQQVGPPRASTSRRDG